MTGANFFDFQERMAAQRRGAVAAPSVSEKAQAAAAPFTVTAITQQIDRLIKEGLPATIHVKGELSNYKHHGASGNAYFTLKDSKACIDCVMWKDDLRGMKFRPADGLEVIATGRIAVYAAKGKHQLYATTLQPVGQGALELAFKQLHAKLLAEGLFEKARKKPIPKYPTRLAIITSSQTAAFQDILKVLRRFRWIKLFLYHVPVQGNGSAEKIAAAIDHLCAGCDGIGGVDAILLARGGGSLEDLWEFNEERVARAMARSIIPIITGIGHEVDTSIADLVADYHAHTPTEAAQVVTHYWRAARDLVDTSQLRLRRAVENRLQHARHRLVTIERHETFRRPMHRINTLRQLLDDRQRALTIAISSHVRQAERRVQDLRVQLSTHGPGALVRRLREKLAALAVCLAQRHPRNQIALAGERMKTLETRLEREIKCAIANQRRRLESMKVHLYAIGPSEVLRRGYSITTLKKTRVVVKSAQQITGGERLITRFADGEVESVADDPSQPRLFE